MIYEQAEEYPHYHEQSDPRRGKSLKFIFSSPREEISINKSAKINAEALQTQGGKLVLAKDWIEKWDGHLPTVQSGSGMIIDVRELLDVKGDKKK